MCGAVFYEDGGRSVNEQFSKNELIARINAIKTKMKLYVLLAIAIPVLSMVLAICLNGYIGDFSYVLVFSSWGVAIFFFTIWNTRKQALKQLIKTNLANDVRVMLTEVFEVESYTPDGSFSAEHIRETYLKSDFHNCAGSDLVKGKYKGVYFAFCDLLLTLNMEETDSDGNTSTESVTVFQGQWVELSLKRPLNSVVYLAERREKEHFLDPKSLYDYYAHNFGRNVQEARTNNDEFNKRYQVFTDAPQDMFNILTPNFMECIIKTSNAANSRTFFCFTGDRARIAMENKRDLFELDNLKKATDFDWLRSKFKADIQFITGVFDEILKNEYLFGT
jgi:hypothetical protein